MLKTSNNLIIIGRGISSDHAIKFLDQARYEADIWRLNQGKQHSLKPRNGVEYHFDIHEPRHHSDKDILDIYKKEGRDIKDINIITRENLNIQELIDVGGNSVLVNTIVLQMAMALKLGYTKVFLPGCDSFNSEEQGKNEELGFVLWLNILRAAGVEVVLTHMCTALKKSSSIKNNIIIIGQKLGLGLELDEKERELLAKYKTIYK